MAKEKIFKPEDFDKGDKANKNWFHKWGPWILGGAALCALVICGFCLWPPNNAQQPEDNTNIPTKEDSTVVPSSKIEEETTVPEYLGNTENEKVEETKEIGINERNIPVVSSNIESEALKVIRGDYGNVPERKSKLGPHYQSIQDRVNQLKKEGFF